MHTRVAIQQVNYTGGIFNCPSCSHAIDHIISVVGWGEGELNGQTVPYWIVRNSWGTYWGEDGWFRIVRGQNQIGIEQACAWATPKVTW